MSRDKRELRVQVETLVQYAEELKETGRLLDAAASLMETNCFPARYAFGPMIPFIETLCDEVYKNWQRVVQARIDEAKMAAPLFHDMAHKLAQVAANYSDTDIELSTDFQKLDSDQVHDRLKRMLPDETYRVEAQR